MSGLQTAVRAFVNDVLPTDELCARLNPDPRFSNRRGTLYQLLRRLLDPTIGILSATNAGTIRAYSPVATAR